MFEWRILYDFSICHVKLLVYTANNTCQWIILYKKLKSNLNRREYYCTRNICEFFFLKMLETLNSCHANSAYGSRF